MHRALILSTACMLVCLPAMSEATPTASTEAVYACADISGDMDRLACYDAAVGRLQAAEAAGEVTTITKTEIEEVQREAFGFSMPSLPKLTMPSFRRGDSDADSKKADNGALNSITVAIKNITTSKHSGLTITLENGQVWQQNDTKSVYYSKRKGAKEAEIKRGALGSFKMKLDGGRAFRVKRLK